MEKWVAGELLPPPLATTTTKGELLEQKDGKDGVKGIGWTRGRSICSV